MTAATVGGAVVYAKDVAAVAAFYRDVAGLHEVEAEPEFSRLEAGPLQVVVVQIPEGIAETIAIADPPERRSDTAVKLVFAVPDIATARQAASRVGGVVDPVDREWSLAGVVRCDGHDPEGNVVQLIQPE